jgi:ribosomal protein L32
MAVPKKKKSVSRKKIRFNSIKTKQRTYTRCDKCYQFVLPHRLYDFSKDGSTNISKKYNSEILWQNY